MDEIDWTAAETFVSSKKGSEKSKKPRVIEAVRIGDSVHYRTKGSEGGISTSDAVRFDANWKRSK